MQATIGLLLRLTEQPCLPLGGDDRRINLNEHRAPSSELLNGVLIADLLVFFGKDNLKRST